MSSIYSTEPPTKGKVILHTTSGDVDIELWPKEAPKAVRNFVQLCLEGYYDGCLFHRVIPELMVQTGDPTGTGLGGESVYGEPFGDELHSRLRFTRRGLVAAAGSSSSGGGGEGGEGDKAASASASASANGSQFFITLGPAPHLDRRHTIFGRVASGDTIYTVAALGEAEVDELDRPCSDPRPRVLSAEVLWNPFDDIVPRTTAAERAARRAREDRERRAAEERASKPGLVAVRDKKLLSFGNGEEEDEDEEDEEDGDGDGGDDDDEGEGEKEAAASRPRAAKKSKTVGMVSAHEAALGDSRLVAAPDRASASAAAAALAEREAEREERPRAAPTASTLKPPRAEDAPVKEEEAEEEKLEPAARGGEEGERKPPSPPPPTASTVSSRRAAALEKGAALRSSAKQAGAAAAAKARQERDAPLLTEWQRNHARFAARKKLSGKRDEATLKALDAFTARLRGGGGGGGGGGEGGRGGGVGGGKSGGASATATKGAATATAARAGAAVAAATFIEQGDVSLQQVAGHKMVARREEDDDED